MAKVLRPLLFQFGPNYSISLVLLMVLALGQRRRMKPSVALTLLQRFLTGSSKASWFPVSVPR